MSRFFRIPVTQCRLIYIGIAAAFLSLTGVAQAQTLYALGADSDGFPLISRISASGVVTNIPLNGGVQDASIGFTIDTAGNFYVAYAGSNTIGKFDSSGNALPFILSGDTLDGPTDLVFDASGNLYAANNNSDTISKITPTGIVSTFATGNHLSLPWQLTFDSAGNLYVANFGDSEFLSKFDSAGNPVSFLTLSGDLDHFNIPGGLAFDASGNLYATGTNTNTLVRIDQTTGVATAIGTAIGGIGGDFPVGLVTDSVGNFYTAGVGNGTISKFDPTGNLLSFTLSGDSISAPFDLAFGPAVQSAAPEPAVGALFTTGLLALASVVVRRRGIV